jgi:hypothetical protein
MLTDNLIMLFYRMINPKYVLMNHLSALLFLSNNVSSRRTGGVFKKYVDNCFGRADIY